MAARTHHEGPGAGSNHRPGKDSGMRLRVYGSGSSEGPRWILNHAPGGLHAACMVTGRLVISDRSGYGPLPFKASADSAVQAFCAASRLKGSSESRAEGV